MIIYKYEIRVNNTVDVPTHKVDKILHFDAPFPGEGVIWMWAVVNPDTGPDHDLHTFHIIETGNPLPFDKSLEHLATVMDGPNVWHVFREVPK